MPPAPKARRDEREHPAYRRELSPPQISVATASVTSSVQRERGAGIQNAYDREDVRAREGDRSGYKRGIDHRDGDGWWVSEDGQNPLHRESGPFPIPCTVDLDLFQFLAR